MNFNIDSEIVDVDIGSNKSVITKRGDIALIDADTLIFSACLHCEVKEDLFSKEFYTEEEWVTLLSDPNYSESEHCIYNIDLDYAFTYSKDKLNTILDNTGCVDYELHFTKGRKSFRYTLIDKNYKANRSADKTKRAPAGLGALKEKWVLKEPDRAFIWEEWEADDIVVAKKRHWPDKYLLVALDKDVLYSLEGSHFNYYSSGTFGIDMKFYDVDKITALKHPYMQTLTGDPSDGVYGLKGIGPKKAENLLEHCSTEKECWDAVVDAYESIKVLKNGAVANLIDAITNMRLVNMHQVFWIDNKWELVLWKPHK